MRRILLILCALHALGSYSQIVSYTTNDTLQFDIPNDPWSIVYLDLDQNGTDDIRIFSDPVANIWFGNEDSVDILNEYVYFTSPTVTISGYRLLSMTDSTISEYSNWMEIQNTQPAATSGAGALHHTYPIYISPNLGSRLYLGVRFNIQGIDLIYRYHYACVDVTLTSDEVVIVHGWSYESQPNTPITCTDSLLIDVTGIDDLNPSTFPILLKITDMMGREIEYAPNIPLIYYYSDGTIRKRFTFK